MRLRRDRVLRRVGQSTRILAGLSTEDRYRGWDGMIRRTCDKMPILYHGTSRVFANGMAGSPQAGMIDVNRSRGEFGRGFYTQSSGSNALRRGYLLYGHGAALLTLRIDDTRYRALATRRLDLPGVRRLNQLLRQAGTQASYTTAHDVIVGPLVSDPRIEQQKFQSSRAEALLNGLDTERIVGP